MGFIDKYPYTDFHELNLDWILDKIKSVEKTVNDFTVFNNITWGGKWDACKSYVKWTIVQDADGNGYISIKPVPSNVPINNTDYWQQIAKYSDLYAAFNYRISVLEYSLPFYDKPNERIVFGGQITTEDPLAIGDYHTYNQNSETIDIKRI